MQHAVCEPGLCDPSDGDFSQHNARPSLHEPRDPKETLYQEPGQGPAQDGPPLSCPIDPPVTVWQES